MVPPAYARGALRRVLLMLRVLEASITPQKLTAAEMLVDVY